MLHRPEAQIGTNGPGSGIYRITHNPQHADMVTVIKGRRFSTCRHRKGISFELVHAGKHVGEVDHLAEHEKSAAGDA